MIKEIIRVKKESELRSSFMTEDIAGVLKELGSDAEIVELKYEYNDNLKKEFDEYFATHKSENAVFCTTAYASIKEFPLDKYYLGNMGEGDKPLPLEETLERDSKVLKECGFIDINNFVNYEYSVAFVYPNIPGLQVVEKIKEILSEDEKEK